MRLLHQKRWGSLAVLAIPYWFLPKNMVKLLHHGSGGSMFATKEILNQIDKKARGLKEKIISMPDCEDFISAGFYVYIAIFKKIC